MWERTGRMPANWRRGLSQTLRSGVQQTATPLLQQVRMQIISESEQDADLPTVQSLRHPHCDMLHHFVSACSWNYLAGQFRQ